jgi:hypothetical protein
MDKKALVEAIKECARFEENAALTLGELYSKKFEWEGMKPEAAKELRDALSAIVSSAMNHARSLVRLRIEIREAEKESY